MPSCRSEKPIAAFSPRGERYGATLYRSQCKECTATKARACYRANKERALTNTRRRNLDVGFVITPERYDEMLAAQSGVCATCGRPETAIGRGGVPMRLAVDHCHATGTLCGAGCNSDRRLDLHFRRSDYGEDFAVATQILVDP